MNLRARVTNTSGSHQVEVKTNGAVHPLEIAAKAGSPGSSVNGGELLFLALATCYCNDIYREAGKRGITVSQVEVEGEFGAEGEPGRKIRYKARVTANATEDEIRDLMRYTDSVAEIQNTLRGGAPVQLGGVEAVSLDR
jgi:organic hydroperoxide reductase OsmC/OhrA